MTRLQLDATSAKTLPHLDKLYATEELDKLSDLLIATPAPVIRRLLLAAISRHVFLSPPELQITNNSAKLLEELVKLNLSGDGELIDSVLDEVNSKGGETSILIVSLARFHVIRG